MNRSDSEMGRVYTSVVEARTEERVEFVIEGAAGEGVDNRLILFLFRTHHSLVHSLRIQFGVSHVCCRSLTLCVRVQLALNCPPLCYTRPLQLSCGSGPVLF